MTLEDLALQVLGSAELPLKSSDVANRAKAVAGKQAAPKAVAAALDALVGAGRVACFMAGTSARPQAFYTPLSLERAAAALLKPHIHRAKKAPEAAKLKAKLPPSLHTHFEPALTLLTAAGDAFIGTGAKRLVHARAPLPSSLLSAPQRKAVQKALDAVNAARTPALTLEDFLAWVDGASPAAAAPAPLPAASGAELPPAPAPAPGRGGAVEAQPAALTEALLQEWYTADRLRSPTVMIPIPQTFARYAAWAQAHDIPADSQVLRNFMEGLYNNGLILLEPCERPQDLPAHERAMLVPMSLGPPGWSWCWAA